MNDVSDRKLMKELSAFIAKDNLDLGVIFRHGIEAAEENDPNIVADYFMDVSEIKNLPESARDLAIDLAVYYGGVQMYKDFDPLTAFEERGSTWS